MKAVLFDLDGTLLDTVSDIHICVNDMLKKYGYPEISPERTRAYIGNGAKKLIERALPAGAQNFEECYTYYRKQFAGSGNEHTRLFAGELETLSRLKARGLQLAVITNKPQDATESCIRKFFPAGLFDFVGGDSGLFPCKPDPSLALYAALSMRVPVSECVFIGDGETDVQTARNAGMGHIAVLWGYRTREQLEQAGAFRFAACFDDLEKFL